VSFRSFIFESDVNQSCHAHMNEYPMTHSYVRTFKVSSRVFPQIHFWIWCEPVSTRVSEFPANGNFPRTSKCPFPRVLRLESDVNQSCHAHMNEFSNRGNSAMTPIHKWMSHSTRVNEQLWRRRKNTATSPDSITDWYVRTYEWVMGYILYPMTHVSHDSLYVRAWHDWICSWIRGIFFLNKRGTKVLLQKNAALAQNAHFSTIDVRLCCLCGIQISIQMRYYCARAEVYCFCFCAEYTFLCK